MTHRGTWATWMAAAVVAGSIAAGLQEASAGADEALVRAVDLPRRAQALRADGVPAAEVSQALEAARGKGLPADEASELLDAADQASQEHGRIDRFGSFVQEKLDEGLRGRELAAAIRAEHEARGIGGGKAGKRGKGKAGEGSDSPEDGPGGGPPEGKGPDGERGGPPEGKGPEGKGPEGDQGPDHDKSKGKGKNP